MDRDSGTKPGFSSWFGSFWPPAILGNRRDHLVAALSDPGSHFIAFPALINALLLTLLALLINNLSGRNFPHRVRHVPPPIAAERPLSDGVGISHADLHAILAEFRGAGLMLHDRVTVEKRSI